MFQDSQREWTRFYNKLMDEYHKTEGELDGLNLTLDGNESLHSDIQMHRHTFLQWKGSITNALSFIRSLSGTPSMEQIREIKDALNEDK